MKKFKCTVTKETTMEIEIDDSVWTDEEIKKWSGSFYEADNLSDIAEHIARMKSEAEDGEFIEGFGIPTIKGKKPYLYIKDEEVATDINICEQEESIIVDIDEI